MKGTKIWILVTAILLLLAGCSNTQPMAVKDGEADVMSEIGTSGGIGTKNTADFTNQKLIKTVDIQAETMNLDVLLENTEAKIAQLGGYVESSELKNLTRTDSEVRRIDMTVRIPAERLDAFVTHVKSGSNVVSAVQKQEDVTLRYTDNESRLKALQTEHDRLLSLMEQAQDMDDVLTIEARVTEVLYEIESMTAQLRKMDDQISYATVTLRIEEIKEAIREEEPGFWQKVAVQFGDNISGFGSFFEGLAAMLIVYSPQLLLSAILIIVAVMFWKRNSKKIRGKWTSFMDAPVQPIKREEKNPSQDSQE